MGLGGLIALLGCGQADTSGLLGPGFGGGSGGPDAGGGGVGGGGADAGRVIPRSRAEAYITPSVHDFGTEAPNFQVTKRVRALNLEDGPAHVYVPRMDSDVFALVDGEVFGTVQPGEELHFDVVFTPRPGTFAEVLTVFACGAGCPQEVRLSGAGYGRQMACEGTQLGGAVVGYCARGTVTCVHDDLMPIPVRPTLRGSAAFRIEAASHDLVPPGEILELDVSFCPTERGAQQTILELGYPVRQPQTIQLNGTGT